MNIVIEWFSSRNNLSEGLLFYIFELIIVFFISGIDCKVHQ
jgi:hypothetical protein